MRQIISCVQGDPLYCDQVESHERTARSLKMPGGTDAHTNRVMACCRLPRRDNSGTSSPALYTVARPPHLVLVKVSRRASAKPQAARNHPLSILERSAQEHTPPAGCV